MRQHEGGREEWPFAATRIDRRVFLRTGAAVAVGVIPGASLLGPLGCEAAPEPLIAAGSGSTPDSVASGLVRELRLAAAPGEVEVGPLGAYRTWLYNGQFPGPEIRVREGERLRIILENRLPEPTTIHWHGVPVPNPMDGVPGVTQQAVARGSEFVYEYSAEPAGSYMYHSHVQLQIDRGLLGALVIEERTPHVAYDREYTLVLDDFLPDEPTLDDDGSMMGGRGGMQNMRDVPDYRAFLVNGRPPADPAALEIRRGERVRLRMVNPSGATVFRVALAGHRLRVTHSDGQPVAPVEVDALLIGPGERYDVLIEASNPGLWNLTAASVNAGPAAARAVVRYAGTTGPAPVESELPDGIRGGRLLALSDLSSVESTGEAARAPDREFDLVLSGGMMMARGWSIDRQRYPDAAPLGIRQGERVRVRLTNMSMAIHPMHLHGHFFRVGGAIKDTVLVPPHMGRVTFEFTADNPGEWFFHCHNLYHMEKGMVRVFTYNG